MQLVLFSPLEAVFERHGVKIPFPFCCVSLIRENLNLLRHGISNKAKRFSHFAERAPSARVLLLHTQLKQLTTQFIFSVLFCQIVLLMTCT